MPPGVVGRVVQMAADPDSSATDLARVLEKDAVLSAHVLRAVNSPLYNLRRKISTIDRAVALLGVRAVRNLVLTLGVRDLVPTRDIGGTFPMDRFWESSLRRAGAARALARRLGAPKEDEFFTLGLCQDLGVLLHVQEAPGLATELSAVLDQGATERLAVERNAGATHDEIGYQLFREWQFPDQLSVPIRFHHDPEEAPPEFCFGAMVAGAADAVADLPTRRDKQTAMAVAREWLAHLGIPDESLAEIVGEMGELVTEFAELFGLRVEEQPTFEDIVATASQGLADLALSYEQMTQRLEEALAEQRRLAESLQEVNRALEERASTDALTGLHNRRSFDEVLLKELAQGHRQGGAVTLILLDLDRFKTLNDTHGHQAGDLVLQEVGRALRDGVRICDTPARYGGEEFAIILPFTDEAGGEVVAGRLRERIAELDVDWFGKPLGVTASLGGATYSASRPGKRAADDLFRRADEALYEAKAAGRDRVRWARRPGDPTP